MAETDKSKHVGKTYRANNEMVAANRMAFQIYLFANYFDQYDIRFTTLLLLIQSKKKLPRQNTYRKVRNKRRGLYFFFAIFSEACIRGRLINEGVLY